MQRSTASACERIELEAGSLAKVVALDAGPGSPQHQDRGLARPVLGRQLLAGARRGLARFDPPQVRAQVASVDRAHAAEIARLRRRQSRNKHRWPSRPGCACDSWPGFAKLEISYIGRPAAASRSIVRLVHAALDFLVDRLDPTTLPLVPQSGPLLVDQPVARKVRRPQRERRLEVGTPVLESRAGDAKDQVQRPAREPRLDDRDRLLDVGAAVMPLEDAQQIWLERLSSQADAVDAGLGQDVGLLGVKRSRVGLDASTRRPDSESAIVG